MTNVIKTNKDPLPILYLLMKVHRKKLSTRPVISCSGSLLYCLGLWVDQLLQPIATRQKSFVQSAYELTKQIKHKRYPIGAKLFTANAVSMYTNIKTNKALKEISLYLRTNKKKFPHVPIEVLIQGLDILMRWNVFTFGDTVWHQISGTAMGTLPAVAWATLFFAIKEERLYPYFQDYLSEYVRYINDIFGVWTGSLQKWEEFKACVNDFHGLEWKFSKLSDRVNFLDITLTMQDNTIQTTLFEKSINQYLYIPPGSAHPPRVLLGLVHGNILRIYCLCSTEEDRHLKLREFF